MGTRYASAQQQIRAIQQRMPRLTAKELWHELTCWPIPSERTIQRFAQGLKGELAVVERVAASAKNRKTRSDSIERTDSFSKEFRMANDPNGDKLDQIISHLGSLHEKHDALKATCDSFGNRIEALEAERQKEKADAAAATAAASAKTQVDAPNEDKHVFADSQMRADAAYQAWGKSAPYALHGETLRNFRVRLLSALKAHSKVYKDSDLATIGDENAFSNIERAIIADAVQASSAPGDAGAPLRKVVSRNDSGHTITKWYGDTLSCWGPFMGGTVRFGKLNRTPNAS
jgi:hypothetical protein